MGDLRSPGLMICPGVRGMWTDFAGLDSFALHAFLNYFISFLPNV